MKNQTVPAILELIWHQGYFRVERSFAEIAKKLSSIGSNPSKQSLNYAISRAKYLTKRGKEGKRRYIQKHGSTKLTSTQDVLPSELTKKFSKDFKVELADLKHNFGISGTCSAFLIRKILEKLLFLAFSKNGQGSHLIDGSGKHIGLQAKISLSTIVKVSGKPFLTRQTADRIEPIKFLGDTAAHNPLANVSMLTIEKEMAYIITAYSELSTWL